MVDEKEKKMALLRNHLVRYRKKEKRDGNSKALCAEKRCIQLFMNNLIIIECNMATIRISKIIDALEKKSV